MEILFPLDDVGPEDGEDEVTVEEPFGFSGVSGSSGSTAEATGAWYAEQVAGSFPRSYQPTFVLVQFPDANNPEWLQKVAATMLLSKSKALAGLSLRYSVMTCRHNTFAAFKDCPVIRAGFL